MGSRALLVLAPAFLSESILLNHISRSGFHQLLTQNEKRVRVGGRNYSIHSNLERPDVTRLAETARISLTPQEAEEFAPKIQQVVDWYSSYLLDNLEQVWATPRCGSSKY